MKLYSIRDWSIQYENNRTRELKKLDWVPVPNRHDGEGYTLVLDQPDGPALFGAWMAILQVASRCGKRGTLLRDNGKPHDAASVARLTRFPPELIERAFGFFSGPEMLWMELAEYQGEGSPAASPCGDPAPACGNPAGECLEGKGTEGYGTEGDDAASGALPHPPAESPFIPAIEKAVAHFAAAGADYTPEEIARAHQEFQATAVGGRWKWGRASVTDWRAALGARLADNRDRAAAGRGRGGPYDPKRALQRELDALLHDPECVQRDSANNVTGYTEKYHRLAEAARRDHGP